MYKLLVADVAAVVSTPSVVLLLLSIAVHSEKTQSLLSPLPPHSQFLSLRAKFIMRRQQYAVFSTILYTGLLLELGLVIEYAVGIFKDK